MNPTISFLFIHLWRSWPHHSCPSMSVFDTQNDIVVTMSCISSVNAHRGVTIFAVACLRQAYCRCSSATTTATITITACRAETQQGTRGGGGERRLLRALHLPGVRGTPLPISDGSNLRVSLRERQQRRLLRATCPPEAPTHHFPSVTVPT